MWYWECFAPHPPVIVPEVGQGKELQASCTLDGMKRLSRYAGVNPPDNILLLSPHAPFSGGITFSLADEYSGDFSRFNAHRTRMSFAGAGDYGERLGHALAGDFHVTISRRGVCQLDHAALVPLFFLYEKRGVFPSLVLANPIGLDLSEAYRLGQRLSRIRLPGSWALVASGDLSHRVTPDAPAGYSPFGKEFDRLVVDALEKNDPSRLLALNERQIDEAGECGLRSALVFLGLSENRRNRVISYEAPFGVGYATAFASLHSAPVLARSVIVEGVRNGRDAARKAGRSFGCFPELAEQSACFVSLKTLPDGKTGPETLRGCIGTILPSKPSLLEEIVENALSAALRDPRFPPVTPEELDRISISVDILSPPEEIVSLEMLDHRKFGVIVEKEGARGVLLPDLEGVESVEQQLSITARKAGISSLENARIYRFSVHRIKEDEQ